MDELALIFDNSQGLRRHQPLVAPLAADAALAVAHRLDLGRLNLEDEGAAVAIAAVRLGGLLCVRHVVASRNKLDRFQWNENWKQERPGEVSVKPNGMSILIQASSGECELNALGIPEMIICPQSEAV